MKESFQNITSFSIPVIVSEKTPKMEYVDGGDSLLIQATSVTPYVELDASSGVLAFKGRSAPCACLDFYYPIIAFIDKAFTSGLESITANFAFEYFNTSSSKCLFDIIKRLAQFERSGISVEVNWFYEEEDEDMRETGEDYEEVLGLSFNYIEIEEF